MITASVDSATTTVLPYAVVGTWVAVGVYAAARHGRKFLRQLGDELRSLRSGR